MKPMRPDEPSRAERDIVKNDDLIDGPLTATFMADYLDRWRRMDWAAAYKERALSYLQAQKGQSILDVGCGTGDDVRLLAEIVGPEGWVVGTDHTDGLVREARRRSAGTDAPVEFHVADARELPFEDSTFDACRTDQVLQHIAETEKVITEMTRVTRPGGRIVTCEPDWETLVVDAADRQACRTVLNLRCDSLRAGWIGRTLPAIFKAQGLSDVVAIPDTLTMHDLELADEVWQIRRFTQAACDRGLLDGERGAAFLNDLEERHRSGRFFACVTGFGVCANKPHGAARRFPGRRVAAAPCRVAAESSPQESDAAALLQELTAKGARVTLEGEQLRFGAPRGVITPELRARLAQAKPQLLELVRRRSEAPGSIPPLTRRPAGRRDRAPLSLTQERLWFLAWGELGRSAYNIPLALRLSGHLSRPALAASLGTLLRRHDVLRSTVRLTDEGPIQEVQPFSTAFLLPLVDLSALSAPRREAETERWARTDAQQPFDLARGPLVRFFLLRLGAREHFLLVTLQHLVADGWSLEILVREMVTCYHGALTGNPAPSLPPATQYGDFAVWQRRWLHRDHLSRQLDYWLRQLGDAPQLLQLPADRPRPPLPTHRGGVLTSEVAVATARRLEALGRRRKATPFMTYLAAFHLLLQRYAGEDDILIGSPIANRRWAEVEHLVGPLINTLVWRPRPTAEATFVELLASVRTVAVEGFAHADLPFEQLVDELAPTRGPGHHPLFQVMFAYQQPPSFATLSELTPEVVHFDPGITKFDLTLTVEPGERATCMRLAYSAELFDATTARRLLGYLECLLVEIAADPKRRGSQLPLLSAAERHQALGEWSSPAIAAARTPQEGWPPELLIHELFARQARRRGDAVAVVSPEGALSYCQLERRSTYLAARLQSLGVGTDVAVAISAEKTLAGMVGLLGILKAGGAYVPLDLSYPPARQRFILDDSGARILLTGDPEATSQLAGETLQVVSLADLEASGDPAAHPAGVAAAPTPGRAAAGHGEQLAYLMYTSGSTGRPKGVAVTHRNVRRLVAEAHYADFGADEVFLQLAPLAFDASTFEIWAPLLHGGRLVLPPARASLREIGRILADEGVTTLWLTAGLFRQMVDEELDALRPLRRLLAGGDVLSPAHVRRVLEELPGCRMVNGYGPTETTTFACCHPVTAPPPRGASIPVGRPIHATQVLLLDRRLEPVPAGVAGELYVGGQGLARGYHRRPALSAERFVPHPLAGRRAAPGARLYRSGDLVRHLADGTLEFLGRIDHQVKVRGFRIEPGEVESELDRHPGVRASVVVARQEASGGERLLAYFVAARKPAPPASELRAWLKETLPEHMVPALLITLDALPLNPNGKVDRRRLPAPETAPCSAPGRFVAPRDRLEESLAKLWGELLGVERVGVFDDFFELGGHSLLATQVVSRIHKLYAVELSLHRFFTDPTVDGLARAVTQGRRPPAATLPLAPIERTAPPPLSFAQERLWLFDRRQPGNSAYHLPGTFELRGQLREGALRRSFHEVIRRHEVLRTTFSEVGGKPVQRIHPRPLGTVLTTVDLTRLDGKRQELTRRLLHEVVARPFDLERGPLVRFVLIRQAARRHVLLILQHHIVSDGWSVDLLAHETVAFYRAALGYERPELPALPVQYADFAAWQRRLLTGAVLERELAAWRRRLDGAPPRWQPPADRPRPAVPTWRGKSLAVQIPRQLGEALATLSHRHQATLFMTLLAAFGALLGRQSGKTELVVGSPVANRNQVEVERLLGFFVNMLALRLDLADDPSFAELLRRVREVTLEAYEHQELPFEKLVGELVKERDGAHHPLFQVVFGFQETPLPEPDFPELEVSFLETPTTTSKFDLTLLLRKGEGLAGTLEYSRDLFDDTTVRRLVRHFEVLLSAAVDDPERSVASLPLLLPAERHQLLFAWNRPEERPPELLIHELFARQARQRGDAVAVVSPEGTLSYGEIDRRSTALAARLRALGVAPEVPVAISSEPTLARMVGLLGILKAGGAYVPLDLSNPAARLRFLLDDSGARILLSSTPEAAAELADESLQVVSLDADATGDDEPAAGADGVCAGHGEQLAYLMYTSGSTGRPKGVGVTHCNVRRLLAEADYADFGPDEVFLQLAPLAFDASTFEIWAPLLHGGRLVLPPARASLREIGRILADEGVTTLWLTAGLFRQMVDEELDALRPLRRLLAGGDVLSPAHVRRVLEELPGCRMVNGYGPTETTTFACCHPVTAPPPRGASIPVGRPIHATQVLLLDRRLEPVPAGVAGELYVGGQGLARGYHRRPGLSAERFVPHPLAGRAAAPGARLYRSGDLARHRGDGTLEFLGRIDYQVKVRGFRIEPGEVEAELDRNPGVRTSVVVRRQEASGDQRLLAYFVAADEAPPRARELRDWLRRSLPEYMVPSLFMRLDALPLNANGKVDRRRLPEPRLNPEQEEGFTAPGSPLEEQLAAIWSEALGVDPVGAHDDFFELGGHSLLASQIVSRIAQELDREVPLSAFFEAPSVAGLAAFLETSRSEATPAAAPQPAGGARRRLLPLSFGQERLWLLDRADPGNPLFDIAAAFRLAGKLDVAALRHSFAEIVRRHEALRTVFKEVDGEPRQEVLGHLDTPIPQVDLRRLPPEGQERETERLAAANASHRFDLERGPLLRTVLARQADERYVILVNFHHIVADGWSLDLFVRELSALYRACRAGRPPALAPLSFQYADYAVRQRQWLASRKFEPQLAWWQDRLRDAPLLELPLDRRRPETKSFRGGTVRATLQCVPELKRLAATERATLFMTLVAVFKVLLAQRSGQWDICVGTPVAGRDRETQDLIGYFMNTAVLRTRLSANLPFRELLGRVRDTTLAAYEHQELPFPLLAEILEPDRRGQRTHLFRALLSLPTTASRRTSDPLSGALDLPGVTAREIPQHHGLSKFDVELYCLETGGEITCELLYDLDLFAQETMERFLADFEKLIERLRVDPDVRLDKLQSELAA